MDQYERTERRERIEQMRESHRTRQIRRRDRKSSFRRLLFFPVAIVYMELILRTWTVLSDPSKPFGGHGMFYAFLFAIGAGLVCNLLASIFPGRFRRVVHWFVLIFVTLIFMIQVVFYTIFRGYAGVGHLEVATDAISNFFLDMLVGIGNSAIPLMLLLLPLALFLALKMWKHRPLPRPERAWLLAVAVVAIVVHVVAISAVMGNEEEGDILSVRSEYRENFTLNRAVENFGLVTALRLDIRNYIFGIPTGELTGAGFLEEQGETPSPTPAPGPPDDPEYPNGEEDPEPPREIPTGYNVLDIDFETLIANTTNAEIREMHEFFMNRRATPRNEWTGRFEGYNLIWFMGEAFHTLALHPEVTPTLYRMANEGFQFTNFYTPDTGFSTTGGEFAMKISLIPRNVNNFPRTGQMYMPFGFGNMFRARGYDTFAYHNWTYSFYNRHISHPNLGYPWRGLGGPGNAGLPLERRPDGRALWPASDLEMIQLTADDFIGTGNNFHVYYVTVSGHLNYNWGGNAMAARHRHRVEHLPYSMGPQAYLATHVELDLAVQYLIDRLEASGQLQNTVFVIVGDHYPYGLSVAEMEELGGAPIPEPIIDVHHSTFILWSASMEEPVVVDTFSSFYDVMPTLANLFALPFDSRLVMGVDILSGVDPLVTFASRSWVSQLGRFNSRTREFTPHPHIDPADIPENHVQQMAARFNIMETYSVRILAHDYYRIVLGNR